MPSWCWYLTSVSLQSALRAIPWRTPLTANRTRCGLGSCGPQRKSFPYGCLNFELAFLSYRGYLSLGAGGAPCVGLCISSFFVGPFRRTFSLSSR